MTITLRPYQSDIVNQIHQSWNAGVRNVLAVCATGSGKSLVLSQIALDRDQIGANQCIMAHRTELVSQMSMHVARRGIKHRIIAPTNVVRQITQDHRREFGRSFINPDARCVVAAAQTLVARSDALQQWGATVHNWSIDESHHLCKGNAWDKAVSLFPNAFGLGVTATPLRADGLGLGRHADGLMDHMILGPSMRDLIDQGSLTEYEILVPPSDFHIDDSAITGSGDYSPTKMRDASKKSHIVGDIVSHYSKHAYGKRAICFTTDVETSGEIAANFNAAGIPAVSVSAKTPSDVRADYIRRYKEGSLWIMVNVDLFDEGFDCLDFETEILTPNGWKNWLDASFEKQCYAWNPETGEAEVVEILKHAVRPVRADEKMLEIESQHTSVRVTEGHRFYQRDVNYYMYNGMSPETVVRTAAEIYASPKNRFALPLCGEQMFSGIPLSDDEIRIIGWYMTDGYLDRGNALSIDQVKKHQIVNIRSILQRLGWKFHEGSRIMKSYGGEVESTRFRIPRRFIEHILPYMDKRNPPALLHDMTREQFKILWSSMMDGNGSCSTETKAGYLVTMHEKQADAFTHMAAVRGFATMFGHYYTKNNVKMYNMRIRDEKWMQFYQVDKRGARFTMTPAKDDELVWCVTNRLGTLITRRNGRVIVLGNCPGTDLTIMARPTASLGKYLQQFGRALRPDPSNPSKVALIIDHVSNVMRHGLPDKPRQWTLDRREKRAKSAPDPEEIPLTVCRECTRPYERFHAACPYCGHAPVAAPIARSIEQVDGDLMLLDRAALAELRERTILESPASVAERVGFAAGPLAAKGAANATMARHAAQERLRNAIAQWAGVQRSLGRPDQQSYRRFYIATGVDVLTALTGKRDEMDNLAQIVEGWYNGAI